MSNRFFIALLVVTALIFGGFTYANKQKDNKNNNTSGNASQASNHTEGSDKTGVVLVEYGDFQCPACGQYYPIVKQVVEQYKDRITFQFRSFPLVQIHPNAMLAHRAAEAADKQGKFWLMHDKLYESQQEWSSLPNNSVGSIFETYAQGIGLDMVQYKSDVISEEVNNIINADIKAGQGFEIQSTPSFILDGVKIENPRSLEDFSKLIDEAIKKKTTS